MTDSLHRHVLTPSQGLRHAPLEWGDDRVRIPHYKPGYQEKTEGKKILRATVSGVVIRKSQAHYGLK